MTAELWLLVASIVLGLLHLIASSHLISWQRGYRWTASTREGEVPPLRGLANRVDQASTNFLETFPFFAVLARTRYEPPQSHYRCRCAFVFLGSCRLSAHSCSGLQLATFRCLLERCCHRDCAFFDRNRMPESYQLHLTNRWSQPQAVAMRRFDFTKQFPEFVTLAAASGGSTPSR